MHEIVVRKGGGPVHFLLEHLFLQWPGGIEGLRLPSLAAFLVALPAAGLLANRLAGRHRIAGAARNPRARSTRCGALDVRPDVRPLSGRLSLGDIRGAARGGPGRSVRLQPRRRRARLRPPDLAPVRGSRAGRSGAPRSGASAGIAYAGAAFFLAGLPYWGYASGDCASATTSATRAANTSGHVGSLGCPGQPLCAERRAMGGARYSRRWPSPAESCCGDGRLSRGHRARGVDYLAGDLFRRSCSGRNTLLPALPAPGAAVVPVLVVTACLAVPRIVAVALLVLVLGLEMNDDRARLVRLHALKPWPSSARSGDGCPPTRKRTGRRRAPGLPAGRVRGVARPERPTFGGSREAHRRSRASWSRATCARGWMADRIAAAARPLRHGLVSDSLRHEPAPSMQTDMRPARFELATSASAGQRSIP